MQNEMLKIGISGKRRFQGSREAVYGKIKNESAHLLKILVCQASPLMKLHGIDLTKIAAN